MFKVPLTLWQIPEVCPIIFNFVRTLSLLKKNAQIIDWTQKYWAHEQLLFTAEHSRATLLCTFDYHYNNDNFEKNASKILVKNSLLKSVP